MEAIVANSRRRYSQTRRDTATPVALAAACLAWFDYTAGSGLSTPNSGLWTGWADYFGGFTGTTGVQSGQMLLTQTNRSQPTAGLWNSGTSWSLSSWIDVSDLTVDNTVYLGSGTVSGGGALPMNPRAYIKIRTQTSGVITITCGAYDNGISAFREGTMTAVVPVGGRVHAAISWDEPNKRLKLYANTALYETLNFVSTLLTSTYDNLANIYAAGSGSASFASQHKSADTLNLFSLIFTQPMVEYLYNNQAGKYFSDLALDSY